MGVVIPQVVTEDRASGAQVIDGSLRFDLDENYHLTKTPGSAGSRTTWTWSCWLKRSRLSVTMGVFGSHSAGNNNDVLEILLSSGNFFMVQGHDQQFLTTTQVFRDTNAWYHFVIAVNTADGTADDRIKVYVNGEQITDLQTRNNPTSSMNLAINQANVHRIGRRPNGNDPFSGYMSQMYLIDGQTLEPTEFGFTDPLTNTWRPKKYTGTFTGTNTFYLPFDGNFPIGHDKSGNGNDYRPVNFQNSAALDKATGALPILNTTSGGKVATVGVRTDANASNLVLALPLVGVSTDVSNQVNSGSTQKVITQNGGAHASSDTSIFYSGSFEFDGDGDFLDVGASSDFAFGTGDFTIEGWVNPSSFALNNSRSPRIYMTDGPTDNASGNLQLLIHTNGALYLFSDSSDLNQVTGGFFTSGEWNHFAVCRTGTTLRAFVNGRLCQTNTYSTSITANSGSPRPRIGTIDSDAGEMTGYLSDLRVYKGVGKYTEDFIPASTNSNILPDTPSGTAYSSKLTKVTEGAVNFDGTNSSLEFTDDGDMHPGSGDFTLECFLYNRNTSGERHYPIIQKGDTDTNNTFDYRLYFNDTLNSTSHLFFDAACSGTDVNMGGGGFTNMQTNRWYHVAVTRASGTFRIFLNGILQGSDSSTSNAIDNDHTGVEIGFNDLGAAGDTFLDGIISNVRFIKGTALYTANFTPPTEPLTNVTNTTLLCCQSPSSATAAAVTPGSITANGDAVATTFNPFNTDINTVRGQETGYCTLNPLKTGSQYTLSEGNLAFSAGSNWDGSCGAFSASSGKWYYEVTRGSGTSLLFGWCIPENYVVTNEPGDPANSSVWRYRDDGTKRNGEGSGQSYGETWTAEGSVAGCALDLDAGTIRFYVNGADQGIAYSNLAGNTVSPVVGFFNGNSTVNFGQTPFKYPPPDGFQSLCLANLPRPSIAAIYPERHFKCLTYTGNNTTRSITDLDFQPDLVWIKIRSNNTDSHALYDSVRGARQRLQSDNNESDGLQGTASLTSFDRNGWTMGNDGQINGASPRTYAAWCWKAGTSFTPTLTGFSAGTASINTEAGFGIYTLTGTNTASSFTHGLDKTPEVIICKNRDDAEDWAVFYPRTDGPPTATDTYLRLNEQTDENKGGTNVLTGNTSTTVSVASFNETASSDDYVYYLWHSVEGFSKIGRYQGNGSSDGVFVECGFKPAFVMVKGISTTNGWGLYDNVRFESNPVNGLLYGNSSNIESAFVNRPMDFVSNGFKCRDSNTNLNASTSYMFMAFAEVPSMNLYGGQPNAR